MQNLTSSRLAAGAVRDVSFLIDFLPSYLFPMGERTISEWVVAGISLGGHATWILLSSGMGSVDWVVLFQTDEYLRTKDPNRYSSDRMSRLSKDDVVSCRAALAIIDPAHYASLA